MKTIVLATDFSKEAQPATDFAFHLAKGLSAQLVLLTVYQHPVPLLRGIAAPLEENRKRNAQRKLYRLRDRLFKASEGTLALVVVARQGSTLETIATVAQEQRADLLVMGTAGGQSPGVEYFGSQATEMILKTPVPLLLVPPTAHFAPFKNLVLALDLSQPVDARALDGALRFTTRFEACLNVICVHKKTADLATKQAAQAIRDLLKHVPHTLTLVEGSDFIQTLLRFSTENRADLIMMLPKAHEGWLFPLLESNTQQVARRADVPVLALIA